MEQRAKTNRARDSTQNTHFRVYFLDTPYVWLPFVLAQTKSKKSHRILESDVVGYNSVKVADFGLSTVLLSLVILVIGEILELTVYHCIIGEFFFLPLFLDLKINFYRISCSTVFMG